uniref:Uncharacterized protein n=1 Tax=Anguilla anguilla TaxID=7936 RepID=A0A0E9V4Z5_ANGAN
MYKPTCLKALHAVGYLLKQHRTDTETQE